MLLYLILLLGLLVITITLEIIYKDDLSDSLKDRLIISIFVLWAYVTIISSLDGFSLGGGSLFSSSGLWFGMGESIAYMIVSIPPLTWLAYLIVPYFIITIIYKIINIFIKK